jgi:uncharacterized UBP type Zn finger protein
MLNLIVGNSIMRQTIDLPGLCRSETDRYCLLCEDKRFHPNIDLHDNKQLFWL